MAYRSQLRTVWRVRSLHEEIRYAELRRAQQAVAASTRQLALAAECLRSLANRQIEDMGSGLTGVELQFAATCERQLDAVRKHQEELHKQLVAAADTARQAVLSQRRDREVVQTLCERRELEHAEELERREQHELDDIFLRRTWGDATSSAHFRREPLLPGAECGKPK